MVKNTKAGIKKYLLAVCLGKDKNPINVFVRFFLQILSCLYGAILALRFYLYESGVLKSEKFNLKIISVGNITTGGTGKTPLVELIIEYFNRHAEKTTVISRGYKGTASDSGTIADEAQMLKQEFPQTQVIINKNRRLALKGIPDHFKQGCVILDDALGHLKIRKNLNIICIDARDPFSNGFLLPRGLMRLPFKYLKKADCFMLNNAVVAEREINRIKNKLSKYNKSAFVCLSEHRADYFYDLITQKKFNLNEISQNQKSKKIALLCAIAVPDGFKNIIETLGINIGKSFFYEDHHIFTEPEIKVIMDICNQQNIKTIITTAKDEPRLKGISLEFLNNKSIEFLVLKVKLGIKENEERFLAQLSALSAD
ncbi:MAG: tetraacyldisaccharide 4'-kinase [Candidatus Omnitrophota bacterium]